MPPSDTIPIFFQPCTESWLLNPSVIHLRWKLQKHQLNVAWSPWLILQFLEFYSKEQKSCKKFYDTDLETATGNWQLSFHWNLLRTIRRSGLMASHKVHIFVGLFTFSIKRRLNTIQLLKKKELKMKSIISVISRLTFVCLMVSRYQEP